MTVKVVPVSRRLFVQCIDKQEVDIETFAMDSLEYLQRRSLSSDQYRQEAHEILKDAIKHLSELKHRLEEHGLDSVAEQMDSEIALFTDDFNGWIDHGIGW